jgi:hypothetical protein
VLWRVTILYITILKISELVNYYNFKRILCITYVTGIGYMQPIDPLPASSVAILTVLSNILA